jgi:hypothetical protein
MATTAFLTFSGQLSPQVHQISGITKIYDSQTPSEQLLDYLVLLL